VFGISRESNWISFRASRGGKPSLSLLIRRLLPLLPALLNAVKLCIDRGPDVNQKNSMGLQAMHGAANRGSNDIIQFLAARGTVQAASR
jgi:ankyrin repeat protein